MNEQRIDKLTRILQNVSVMGGEAETTKIVTNLEVTDATPPVTTVPAGYIIVENDQGFNVPAQEVPGVSYADGDLVNVLYVKGSEPVAMQQGSSSPSSNLWELVPATTTDIFYDGGLVGINNPAPAENLDILGSVVVDTDVFYVDDVNDFIGMGTVVSTTSQQLSILMDASKDILIDGTTNNRLIDTGVIRFEQTPAITDTRALTVNMDINSQVNSHALVVNLVATQLQAGESVSAYDINIDTANASGGIVRGFEVSCAGAGTVDGCHALHVDPNVSPIFHLSGSFISVEQAWQDDGGFVDTTAAFNGAPDINIFVNNGAVCYWGMAATFDQIEVVLNTVASGPGIKPTFEFSDGIGGWTVFTPSDESQGFRQNGIISWTITDLVGWAVDTVNAVANKYWIRITRTQVALTTPPNEETLLVAATTEYTWDKDGIVTIAKLGVGITPTAKFHVVGATDEIQTIIRGNATQTSNLVELQNSGSTTLIFVDGTGKFDQTVSLSTPTAFTVAHNQTITFAAGAVAITNTQRAMSFVANATGSAGGGGNVVGVIGEAQSTQSAGTITSFTAMSAAVRIAGAGSATVGYGIRTVPILTSTGNLVTWRGVEVRPAVVSGAGTITNLYGIYIDNQSAGTALNYAIYTNDGIVFLKDRVSIGGIATPLAQIHIDQASAVAAIPVAIFDQADVSEEMFEFVSTIGVGNAIEAVGAKSLTTTHFIKVTLPGGLTRYFPVGTIA